jgi:hypothetical protein
MRKLAVALVALALSACASAERLDAANDVHALLVAIRDDDKAAFDAHVDRAALKRELQAQVDQRLDKRLGGLSALLGQDVVSYAGDQLVQPRVFRLVAEQYGYKPGQALPNVVAIAGALKSLPDGRVCAVAKKDGPCVLTFTKEDGVWKLTSFDGAVSTLRLKL